VSEIAPEELFGLLPGMVDEIEVGEPAMADLLPSTLSVLFSPRNRVVGSSGYLPSRSIMVKLRSRPALPNSRDKSKRSTPIP
jgi:hypothetical protein